MHSASKLLLQARILPLSAMAQLAKVISELDNSGKLYAAQVAAGLGEAEVQEALHAAMELRLANLHIADAVDQEKLTVAITAGPWSDVQRQALARIVLRGSASSPCASSADKSSSSRQSCLSFGNFIPEQVWSCMRKDGWSIASMEQLISTQAFLLNLKHPSEPTLFRMVQIIAYCGNEGQMEQDDVFDCMDRLSNKIKAPRATQMPTILPHLAAFPDDAAGLPAALRDFAYGDIGAPPTLNIPSLDTCLSGTKMRGRRAQFKWIGNVPAQFQQQVKQALVRPLGYQPMGVRAASLQQAALGYQPVGVQPSRQNAALVNQPMDESALVRSRTSRASQSPCYEFASSEQQEPMQRDSYMRRGMSSSSACNGNRNASPLQDSLGLDDTECDAEDGHDEGIDALENMMLGAASASVAAKAALAMKKKVGEPKPTAPAKAKVKAAPKGKASPKAKAKGKAKASPKAKAKVQATAHIIKRPAAPCKLIKGVPCMKDVFDELWANHADMNRNGFTSRAYKTGQSRARKLKLSEAQSRDFARLQLTKASLLWDSLK